MYWRCSRRKLEFIPATPNAVITIVPPSDVCGMKWREAGDYAIDELQNQFEYIDRSHTLIVMPNCVDFEGAAAWAESPGSKSWYRSLYASLPLVSCGTFFYFTTLSRMYPAHAEFNTPLTLSP